MPEVSEVSSQLLASAISAAVHGAGPGQAARILSPAGRLNAPQEGTKIVSDGGEGC